MIKIRIKRVKFGKYLKTVSTILLIFSWLLTGWPGIFVTKIGNREFTFPPKIKEAKAVSCGFGSEVGTTGVCRGFLTTTGSLQTWTSPSDWNNSSNTIECIGAGGSGGAVRGSLTASATGGGGGAYSLISNFSVATPGTTQVSYQIGTGGPARILTSTASTAGTAGGDTWFNNSTYPGAGTDNTYCGAKGGSAGNAGAQPQSGGTGGVDTSGWGLTRRSGGSGGTASHDSVATGGGGSAGNSNIGGSGVSSSAATQGTSGGQANGSGATGGSGSSSGSGSNGGDGTEYTTEGSGGGGGGGVDSANARIYGGDGGKRGGGGGAAVNERSAGGPSAESGTGYNGIIVISYTPKYTELGSGTDPSTTTVAPDSGIVDAGSFTLLTSTGTDSVTALTVILAGSGTPYDGLSEVRITSDNGSTTYFSAISNPSSNTLNFSGGTAISVTTSSTQYKIRVTPKTHSGMPVPNGAEYALLPYVSAFTSTNSQKGTDSNANTLTVDNLSPNSATSVSGSAGNAFVTLNWTSSSSSDFDTTNGSVILRWASGSAGSEVPAEGNSSYTAGNTITTATVACVISSAASASLSKIDGSGGDSGCTTTALTNGQQYTYKVFQRDTRGNYDTGTSMGTFTPTAAPATFTQNHYRWYVDSDSENVTDPWSSAAGIDIAEDTILTPIPVAYDPPNSTQEIRLRVNITVNSNTISANTKYFKLQFRTGTDSDCSTGSWTDVDVKSTGSAAWRYADSSVTDDTTLTVAKLTGTDRLETYSNAKPANTPTATSATGEDIEFDFHVVGANSTSATRYLFRVVETTSDGLGTTALTAWTNCPVLNTEPGTDDLMRHGNFFSGDVERGFSWAN